MRWNAHVCCLRAPNETKHSSSPACYDALLTRADLCSPNGAVRGGEDTCADALLPSAPPANALDQAIDPRILLHQNLINRGDRRGHVRGLHVGGLWLTMTDRRRPRLRRGLTSRRKRAGGWSRRHAFVQRLNRHSANGRPMDGCLCRHWHRKRSGQDGGDCSKRKSDHELPPVLRFMTSASGKKTHA